MKWHVVYRKAIEDGKLFFPEKLSHEFLERAKRTQGSYIFANQYMNEIIPTELQTFKKEWFQYYEKLPSNLYNFLYVDPALSEADGSDFTGMVVVSLDSKGDWYVRYARRFRLSPTQIVSELFRWNAEFQPQVIGIEEVAYQKALLYFLDEEMRRRNVVLPVKGIRPPTDRSKQARILSMVPRFEWNRVHLARGLTDLEMELLQFPRGAHDDLIDALASIEYIAYSPSEEKRWPKPPAPGSPDYEAWYIHNLQNKEDSDG